MLSHSVFITSSACVLPNAPVDNSQIEKVLGLINNKASKTKRIVLRNNGIKLRHYVLNSKSGKPSHTNAQLSAKAIKQLFNTADALNHIDLICTGTTIADQLAPGHAVMVHGELGSPPCEVASLSGICISGLMALKYGFLALKNDDSQMAVITGSEVVSPLLHAHNFSNHSAINAETLDKHPELGFNEDFLRWMLSDGAGALCLETQPRAGQLNLRIEWIKTYSYANEIDTCMYLGAKKIENGGLLGWMHYQPNAFTLKQDVKLLNYSIIEFAINQTIDKIIACTGIQASDIDYFLPHASSMYFMPKIKQALEAKNFAIPMEKWFTNLATKGNTGAASIFIMLDEFIKTKSLKPGNKILCFVPESGRFSSGFMLLTVV
ncbi:MAG: hypothetical protein DSY43_03125 [Gammaproteobacteria bacterium]|nr:MAG: hypothetical protein DSY43_03125 [Gammaproteobacteria bacterium]